MSAISATRFLPAGDNPFASEFIEAIPFRFARGDWEFHLQRLRECGFHAAIVGPHGSGKTTLLEQLADRLTTCTDCRVELVIVTRQRRRHRVAVSDWIAQKRKGTILLIDGMERMSRANRYLLLASGFDRRGGLVVTRHRRCWYPTWVRCESGPVVLQHALDHLKVRVPPFLWAEARDQLRRNRGNVRDVLRYLYDQYAAGDPGHSSGQRISSSSGSADS